MGSAVTVDITASFAVLLCLRSNEPFLLTRGIGPTAIEALFGCLPGSPFFLEPLTEVWRPKTLSSPPGAGKSLRAGSAEEMLVWKSSKVIDGKKSTEFKELSVSSFKLGAKEPKLKRDVSSADACLE